MNLFPLGLDYDIKGFGLLWKWISNEYGTRGACFFHKAG